MASFMLKSPHCEDIEGEVVTCSLKSKHKVGHIASGKVPDTDILVATYINCIYDICHVLQRKSATAHTFRTP